MSTSQAAKIQEKRRHARQTRVQHVHTTSRKQKRTGMNTQGRSMNTHKKSNLRPKRQRAKHRPHEFEPSDTKEKARELYTSRCHRKNDMQAQKDPTRAIPISKHTDVYVHECTPAHLDFARQEKHE